jgi:hypothetical protein
LWCGNYGGGHINKEELAQEFASIYETNWPWKIRELGDSSFLVKFPPHIPLEQVTGDPRFGMSRNGLTVKAVQWSYDPKPVESLVEVWLQIRGMLPPWCELDIIDQVVSVCGLLREVDWTSVFKNCAEVVRIRVLCRDSTKIPYGRLFNFHGSLFQLQFTTELENAIVVYGNLVVQVHDHDQNGGGPGENGNNNRSLAWVGMVTWILMEVIEM